MEKTLTLAAALIGAILPAAAQPVRREAQIRHERVQDVTISREAAGSPERHVVAFPPAAAAEMEFLSHEFLSPGQSVKGAPYSAEAVTESIETLADGNRIVRKVSASVARDSEGRSRRDMIVGGGAQAGANPAFTFIHDPVAGVSYTLDHTAKVARKAPGQAVVMHIERRSEAPAAGVRVASPEHVIEEKIIGPTFIRHPESATSKTESLGKQTIEGVVAEGTRTVTTIPAGEIGNERPINIVSERWHSPDLQMVVMSKHSDPRRGETTYRLTNLRRSEPLKSLFEVPADYTVKTEAAPMRQLRMKSHE
jgi:hypothetical protein